MDYYKAKNCGDAPDKLVRLYMLGGQLCDAHVKNWALDCIIDIDQTFGKYPGRNSIKLAWDNLTSDSPLRRLILDYWTHCLRPASLKSRADNLLQDFIFDLLLSYNKCFGSSTNTEGPSAKTRQQYHEAL